VSKSIKKIPNKPLYNFSLIGSMTDKLLVLM